jgi:hypothetical protein
MGMLRNFRRPPLPADAAQALEIGSGERVLTWSVLTDGGVAAATIEGLRVRPEGADLVVAPWTDIDHAVWDAESAVLSIWWVGSPDITPLALEEDSFLPEVVHERVRASVVLTRDVPLPGGRALWIALRKGSDGTLTTQVAPPLGVRLDDPQIAAVVARAEAALREEAGL